MVFIRDVAAGIGSHRLIPKAMSVALASAIALLASAPGRAADVSATTAGAELTEVIVTAQKREQNIQDVPISVMALSGQQLQDAGVTDIKNMQVLTPGLTVTSTTSENSTTARIRGIGTVGDNRGLESSVGVVIDGVYRPRNGVGFGDLGEIEQIEVLEGPQGELFGKNNDAGVINIVTKRPSDTFGVTGEISGGNFDDREVAASITGPLGDISACRLYAGYQKRDGFLDVDTGPGPNTDDTTNNRNLYTMRGQFLLTPTSDVNLLVIGDYSKRNEVCCGAVPTVRGPWCGIINALAADPSLGGKPGAAGHCRRPATSASTVSACANHPIAQQIRDMGFSAQLDWNFGRRELTSITAWRDNTLVRRQRRRLHARRHRARARRRGNQTDFKQFSEELRLAGKDGPLDWLVGGFFSTKC